jgi:hypothetical protein
MLIKFETVSEGPTVQCGLITVQRQKMAALGVLIAPFRAQHSPPVTFEGDTLALGGRLADFLYQGRSDALLVNWRDTLAELAQLRLDTLPDERSLSGVRQSALGKAREIGNMPLYRLPIDALVLDQDCRPMNVRSVQPTLGEGMAPSLARLPSHIHEA